MHKSCFRKRLAIFFRCAFVLPDVPYKTLAVRLVCTVLKGIDMCRVKNAWESSCESDNIAHWIFFSSRAGSVHVLDEIRKSGSTVRASEWKVTNVILACYFEILPWGKETLFDKSCKMRRVTVVDFFPLSYLYPIPECVPCALVEFIKFETRIDYI